MDKVASTGRQADNKYELIMKNEIDVLHMAPKEELSSPSHHPKRMAGNSSQKQSKMRRTKSEGSMSRLTFAIVNYQASIKSINVIEKSETKRFNSFMDSCQLNEVKQRSKGAVESNLADLITYTSNLTKTTDYLLEAKDKEITYLKEKLARLEAERALFGNIASMAGGQGLSPPQFFHPHVLSPPTAPAVISQGNKLILCSIKPKPK